MPDKTMKQIADYLGCPKIRVYRYIKSNHISETYQNGNTLYYDEAAAEQIIFALKNECEQLETIQNTPETVQEYNETLQETVLKQLDLMKSQLIEKDKQLAEKDKQIEALTATLNLAQETQQQLTSALTAAQALHAGTIQKQLTEQSVMPKENFLKKILKKIRSNGSEDY